MMRLIIVFLYLVIVAIASEVTYENYKVFQTTATSKNQIQFLKKLVESKDAYSFWDHKKSTIMVAPAKLDEFIQLMNAEGIQLELIHEEMQTLINQQRKRRHDNFKFSWTQYHTLDEIYDWLENISEKYSGIVKVIIHGRTYEDRAIKGIHISFRKDNPGIFIESGIHACEWIAPATATYIANELLTSKDPIIRQLAESYDWYIFPSFNPDGYIFSHTTDRMWRKNRAPTSGSCYGVDLNRNWGHMWAKIGVSNNTCHEWYAGRNAFSEIETKTMSKFIESIAHKLYAYIAFHSYSQLLLIPYGYTSEHLDNYNETYLIGKKAINALSQKYGTKYIVGNPPQTLYPAAGLSMDWVKAKFRLPIVYTYEFRDQGHYGFLLPPEQIISNAEEVLDSLVAMFNETIKSGCTSP